MFSNKLLTDFMNITLQGRLTYKCHPLQSKYLDYNLVNVALSPQGSRVIL
jgi:hypothetical protein